MSLQPMPLQHITRESVLQAIKECDELGQERFLENHGFGPSKTTWLHYNGQHYVSKAITGVARGYARPDLGPLSWNEFHGGEQVRKKLRDLGFEVRSTHFLPPKAANNDPFDPKDVEDARKWVKKTIAQRRGQRSFRDSLISVYGRECAITGCSTLDVLEAAHIFPYRGPETNHPSNGLLLRADLHTLFDCGLLAIHPDEKTVIVASSVKDKEYRKLHGRRMKRPRNREKRPSKKALRLHLEDCQEMDI